MLNALVLDFVTQSRLKRIANGRADRLRPAGPNVTDSSFPTSGHIASGKVHFTAAPPPRAPRASHLTVGAHYVRPQSVELRSQTDETDIKSPSIYSEAPPTPRYPPLPKSPEPNHEVEDDDDELDVEIDGDTLARNHGLDLERNGSSHRSASSRRPVAAEAESEAYELTERPPTRLQKYQRHSSLAYYNDETEEYDLGFDHMRYTPEPPSPWDPTASFAQGSSSQTVTWAPSVGASGYDDLALSRTVSNPSLAPSPPPSALLSVRGALKGFAALQSAGSSSKSAPMSFPRPMNTVVVVTSASETRVDTE
ncbi:hypothetical protein DL93DRAFT_1753722 [Clavulina sp. PMI_390]|nr:hypothetical protein DL93DRAFT_1753722 [Clavulina sp. PMI_390]